MQQHPLNVDKIRFLGKLLSAAHSKGGSIGDDSFKDQLFSEWSQTGLALEQAPAWLNERLSNTFLSADADPSWVEDEPDWPFHNGSPMTFIGQLIQGKDGYYATHLSPGCTLYIFGARVANGNGFSMIYRVVEQFGELSSADRGR